MNKNSHIAVLAFPFGTHAAPLLNLVERLAAASLPTVHFSFLNTATSNASIFLGQKYVNIKAYNVWDGMPEAGDGNFIGSKEEIIVNFAKATPDNFKKGIEEAEKDVGVKVGCLLTDAFFWFAGDMAEEMGAAWVPLWTAGAGSLSAHLHTELICSMVKCTNGKAESPDQPLDFIPGMSAILADDIPGGVIFSNPTSTVAQMLHKMELSLPRATAVVLNSFQELDSTIIDNLQLKLQKVLNIGPSTLSYSPPTKPDESGSLLWLDNQKASSVAYISFGSIVTLLPNELVALAEALETNSVPFLWSLPAESKVLLPEGLLERTSRLGKFVSWAPQLEVLAHSAVGVFVTHCGWNSVLEAISYGVPMICRPVFGDQMLNSRMVESVWKIGVRIELGTFTKSGMVEALDVMLCSEKGKEMRERVGVLKEQAMEAVGSNGSSTSDFETLKVIITCKQAQKIYWKD